MQQLQRQSAKQEQQRQPQNAKQTLQRKSESAKQQLRHKSESAKQSAKQQLQRPNAYGKGRMDNRIIRHMNAKLRSDDNRKQEAPAHARAHDITLALVKQNGQMNENDREARAYDA
jgi:hypothetical protein